MSKVTLSFALIRKLNCKSELEYKIDFLLLILSPGISHLLYLDFKSLMPLLQVYFFKKVHTISLGGKNR